MTDENERLRRYIEEMERRVNDESRASDKSGGKK
jgi:hypothetical protein